MTANTSADLLDGSSMCSQLGKPYLALNLKVQQILVEAVRKPALQLHFSRLMLLQSKVDGSGIQGVRL